MYAFCYNVTTVKGGGREVVFKFSVKLAIRQSSSSIVADVDADDDDSGSNFRDDDCIA